MINQRLLDTVQDLSVRGYQDDFAETVNTLAGKREHELRQFVPDSWLVGLETQYLIRKGNPAEEIMAAAKELVIEMIVLGSREHSALATLFVGSVA